MEMKKFHKITIGLLILVGANGCCKHTDLCSITSTTTGQDFIIELPDSKYNKGEDITVNMISTVYSFGQAKNVALYLNETMYHYFGSWLYFSGNSRSFTIPATTESGQCYTMRITKEGPTVSDTDDEIYVSDKLSIE